MAISGIKINLSDLDFILKQLRLPNNQPVLPIDMTGIRDVSGVGNNINFPTWGATDTPFTRLFTPNFTNYIPNTWNGNPFSSNPGVASSYATRDINLQDATPRQISNIVANSDGISQLLIQDDPLTTPGGRLNPLTGLVNPLVYSGYLSLVGQFFDHGLDFVQKGADGYVVIKLDDNDPLLVGPHADPAAVTAPFQVISRTNTVHVDINVESTDSLITALGLVEQRYTTVNPTTVEVGGVTRQASYVLGSGTVTPTDLINGGAAGVFKLNNVAINIAANSTGADLINAINAYTNNTGVSASISVDNHLQLTYLNGESINRISPFIDLSQQYGSVASQTAFLREYDLNGQITGHLAGHVGAGLGMATWADIKHNASLVGVTLHDIDVTNIPEVRLDATGAPYLGTGDQLGMWLVARDKATGAIYYVKNSDINANSTVLDANGVLVSNPGNLKLQVTNHAFLDDIAHVVDFTKLDVHGDFLNAGASAASYASLNAHYIAGDGRTNENIGLTSIHDIFHKEHESVLQSLMQLDATRAATEVGYVKMTGEELFQGAKLVVEMEYQHMIFGEFARKLSPNIGAFAAYDPTENPAISQEFANAVYRLGHSMLTDSIDTTVLNGAGFSADHDGKTTTANDLYDVFLNPTAYATLNNGPISAAGQVAMGMSAQVGNAIDQWVTDTLRNKLVGLPLDLAAANIVRGRDTGLPTFEEARDAVYAQTGMIQFAEHLTWYDFAADLMHSNTVVDFIEAYADLSDPGSVYGFTGTTQHERALEAVASDLFMGGSDTSFRNVDLWLGGLAEAKETNGMLGTLFDFVFATQMSHLQNNDRFYYLGRLVGTDLLAQIESQLLVDIVQRNSGATHIYNDIFSVADNYVEMSTYNPAIATHNIIATSGTPADAGYASNGAFYGDNGEYTDARGVASPNGVGKSSEMIGGTSGNDKIFALDGNDSVWADGGSDTVDGGNGNDFIHGGDGNDKLDDFGGDDFLWGDAGNDTVNGGAGLDQVFGGDGNDDLYGSDGGDIMEGGQDNDLLFGDWGRSPALATGVVGQYLHFNRAAGTAFISTSSTVGAGESVVLLNGNMDALGGADVMGGGAGNDALFGGGGGDALDGSDGNDTIMGGGGADAALGGLGDDLFLADANDFAFNNTMDGGDGFDTVSYQLSVRAVSVSLANAGLAVVPPGTNVADSFINVEGLIGSNFNDTLMGDGANNVIEGLAGNDTIDGGLGMDMISYRSVSIANGTATTRGVTLNLAVASQGNTTVGAGTDTILNIEGAIGSIYADSLTGNALDNTFEGLAGNDTINGGAGNDTVSYAGAVGSVIINLATTGQQAVNAEIGRDTLTAIENVIGGRGADQLLGTTGNNVIDGGAYVGAVSSSNTTPDDVLNGLAGNDTVSYASALSGVKVSLATQGANVYQNTWGGGYDSLLGFENVTGSAFSDQLTGDATANIITGGAGDDTMLGGAGNDIYMINYATEHGINEYITDTPVAVGDQIRYAQVGLGVTPAENTLTLSSHVTGIESIVIGTGTAAAAVTTALDALNVDASALITAVSITGNAGANILSSGLGIDTLVGGDGNDTYVVNNVGDVITETATLTSGTDTVNVNIVGNLTYVLGANLENGTVVSASNVNLTGNALANVLTGNAGNNILDGLAGADTLVGGLGNDTYVIDNALDVIQEFVNEGVDTVQTAASYVLSADLENLTLLGAAAINGTGNDLDNLIIGNGAINVLAGGLGADSLQGAAGNDIYMINAIAEYAGDIITDTSGTADEIRLADIAAGTLTLSADILGIERVVIGTGIAAAAVATATTALNVDASLTGTAGVAGLTIVGNAGVNIISGGLGIDTLSGGSGNDIYMFNSLSTYTNGATADTITDTVGTADEIRFAGTSGNLIVSAATTGIERVVIGTGTATNAVSTGTNAVSIDASAIATALAITGNAGVNTLIGGAGANVIAGGAGGDTLTGNAGVDTFTYVALTDSFGTGATRDIITDFVKGTDRISLSGIDANSVTNGDQAFTSISLWPTSTPYSGYQQLHVYLDGQYTIVEGNTTGGTTSGADFAIALLGDYVTPGSAAGQLALADFIL